MKAADRISASGENKNIADEIGANEWPIAKWALAATKSTVSNFIKRILPKDIDGKIQATKTPASDILC
ncbi:MAG: hypothetical protein ACI85V_002564 [bacterium]